jgi:urea carboxylase-associated protein 1
MPEFSQTLPAGAHWSRIVQRGEVLRIIDLEGHQGVDFLCYNAGNPEERYHAPNTIKAAGTLALTLGHRLYSDEARPMMTITEDTVGHHDTIGGCCSAPSNALLYGVTDCPGCRENFLEALAAHGLGRRDIVPNLNFFCNVPVRDDNRLADTVFVEGRSSAGAHLDLRAEMDVIAVLSNCPQVNNPCNDGKPGPIAVEIYAGSGHPGTNPGLIFRPVEIAPVSPYR